MVTTIKGVGIETMQIRPEPDLGLFPCQGSGFKLVVQPYSCGAGDVIQGCHLPTSDECNSEYRMPVLCARAPRCSYAAD